MGLGCRASGLGFGASGLSFRASRFLELGGWSVG